MTMPKFGSAGNPDSFYEAGYKASVEMPEYLRMLGLDTYEYQCGKGVRISEKTALELRDRAMQNKIELSVHSPYYINLANPDEKMRERTIGYIFDTLRLAKIIKAERIVVHAGSIMKMTRRQALENALDTLKEVIIRADSEGLGDIRICPETMGKINQLGNLDEVITLCELDERLLPCVDFGHLNARTLGKLKTKADFEYILNQIENRLGNDRMKHFHSHFSKIEYTKGGEKRHLTFEDTVFGPEFAPLAEVLFEKESAPVIICESDGTQTIDALIMQKLFRKAAQR
jgi:deoxyribonuclease-4